MGFFQRGLSMRTIIAVTAALMLAGCATPEQQVAKYQGTCARQGIQPGTQDFNNCVGFLISENERNAAQLNAYAGFLGAVGSRAAAQNAAREGYGDNGVQCTSIPNGPYVYTNCH